MTCGWGSGRVAGSDASSAIGLPLGARGRMGGWGVEQQNDGVVRRVHQKPSAGGSAREGCRKGGRRVCTQPVSATAAASLAAKDTPRLSLTPLALKGGGVGGKCRVGRHLLIEQFRNPRPAPRCGAVPQRQRVATRATKSSLLTSDVSPNEYTPADKLREICSLPVAAEYAQGGGEGGVEGGPEGGRDDNMQAALGTDKRCKKSRQRSAGCLHDTSAAVACGDIATPRGGRNFLPLQTSVEVCSRSSGGDAGSDSDVIFPQKVLIFSQKSPGHPRIHDMGFQLCSRKGAPPLCTSTAAAPRNGAHDMHVSKRKSDVTPTGRAGRVDKERGVGMSRLAAVGSRSPVTCSHTSPLPPMSSASAASSQMALFLAGCSSTASSRGKKEEGAGGKSGGEGGGGAGKGERGGNVGS